MTSNKALYFLFVLVLILVGGVMTLNYTADPQCFYRCPDLDVQKRTLNTYYQVAQRILAHPDAQVIILGSSRGETLPPLWLQEKSGLKTLNLSSAGAEATTKLAFLKIAEQNTQMKKVIWLADYFELVGATQDAKIKNTPALKKFLKHPQSWSWSELAQTAEGLLSHNTFEASLNFMKNKEMTEITQGAGSFIDYKACESPDFQGLETAEALEKEIGLLYQNYTRGIISPVQSKELEVEFLEEMRSLAEKGIGVEVIILPYHRLFLDRLKSERPEILDRHLAWIEKIKSLDSVPGIQVVDNFNGIAGADDSHVNWNDGVHFNCRAAMKMLTPIIQAWK